jgi:type VI secretion system secreted protein VgrG
MPPYDLPDEKTKTYLKTNSSKGGDGHNELRFDDKAGDEQIYVHGQKDMDVYIEKKETRYVGPDGQHVQVKGDCRRKVEGKLSDTVSQDHHEKVDMNYALESGMGLHIKGGMTVVIEAGMQLTLKVGGNFVDISPVGVCIQGTLVNINSGGAPGSGSGASPDSPDVCEQPGSTSGSKSSD